MLYDCLDTYFLAAVQGYVVMENFQNPFFKRCFKSEGDDMMTMMIFFQLFALYGALGAFTSTTSGPFTIFEPCSCRLYSWQCFHGSRPFGQAEMDVYIMVLVQGYIRLCRGQ